jgi:hypothetical protein
MVGFLILANFYQGGIPMYKLSPEDKKILNDEELIVLRDKGYEELDNLLNGKPLQFVPAQNGTVGTCDVDLYKDPEGWLLGCLSDLAKRSDLLRDKNCFRPLMVEFAPYGVHFSDHLLGCRVYFNDTSKQWYNDYLDIPVGTLEPCDLESHVLWKMVKRVVNCFLEQEVSLPIFSAPIIASALNVAVNLYSDKILMDMIIDGSDAKHDLAVIHELLCSMHRYFRTIIPENQFQLCVADGRTQPPGHGQLCGCTTQLISMELYKNFIAPLDDEMFRIYPHGGMIHLCGTHTQHIPVWRDMKSLQAVQVNDRASEDLEIYFNELRDNQIFYFYPCDGMTIEKAMAITGGKRLVIVGVLEKRIPVAC